MSSLTDYKAKYPAILAALKKGKEVVDIEVENALYKRTIGYEYTETRKEFEGEALAKETETVKFVPPDVTAQIFWLKNRAAERWRDRAKDETGVKAAELALLEQQARIDKLTAEIEQSKKRLEMEQERHKLEMAMMGAGAAEDETRDNFVDMFKADAAEVWRDAAKADPGETDGV
jgi:hypothetical protein